jgi:arginyl-tRNA synthetase
VLAERVQKVVADWVLEQGWQSPPEFLLERPPERAHGDYATPFCMQLARVAHKAPRVLAEELRARLLADQEVAAVVDAVDIAGPGFLNFRLATDAFPLTAAEMLSAGEEVGHGVRATPLHILLEYVSVNPNGPLHVGHGRYAAYGDSLGRILRFSGHRVTTEFYINDYGRQMERFSLSVAARYAQSFDLDLPVPEDGYQGEYVKDIAQQLRDEVGDRYLGALRSEGLDDPRGEAALYFRARGTELMLEEMKAELRRFRVEFDIYFSETPLHTEGRVQGIIDHLLTTGDAYELDDAVWLRTTPYGDDKDRVLIRSNEQPTYFAADIAYHQDKIARGYTHLINVWGADHHGYVPRMKASVEILSHDPDMLELIIGQLVNLLEAGELRQMSTRRGEMVTLDELIDAIGVDAARFFLVTRSQDQTLDLDMELARRQSAENPVYYVQYAHARIASILRNVPAGLEPALPTEPSPHLFATDYERDLIKKLDEFSSAIMEAADRRAPHRIAGYAQELAGDFHVFYKNCRVIGSEPDVAAARLALCLIARRVIARCLELLGVSTPEVM